MSHLSDVLQSPLETEVHTNSEADNPSSNRSSRIAIYVQLLIHRSEPNRPHISSDISNFKERETKQTEMRRILLGAPRLHSLCFSLRLVAVCVSAVARLAPRSSVAAASVRGYLRIAARTRNPFFWKSSSFFQKTRFPRKNRWLDRQFFVVEGLRPGRATWPHTARTPDLALSPGLSPRRSRVSPGTRRVTPRFSR